MFKRVFLIILDSCGVSHAKDSDLYYDTGANTFGHVISKTKVDLPNLRKMGFHNLSFDGNDKTNCYYMRANEASSGKDTLTGHLEIMGIKTEIPYKTFSDKGFPKELIRAIEKQTGYGVIGNKKASSTEIINEFGEEHMNTGKLIVYTGADSVLQIAAHEDVIALPKLYQICEVIRRITTKEEWRVGRIIARPFTGEKNSFKMSNNRRDYALDPHNNTYLDWMKEKGLDVLAIGKIGDIFNNRGITSSTKTENNLDGLRKLMEIINIDFQGLCFVNLSDFDTLGHRRDVKGYAKALKEFDDYLPNIVSKLKQDDLLILSADHGNDPTWIGLDHTRENIPVAVYSKSFKKHCRLDDLNTFADIGATIADNFHLRIYNGESFLNKLK